MKLSDYHNLAPKNVALSTNNDDYVNCCKYENNMHRCRPEKGVNSKRCKGWRPSSTDDTICMYLRKDIDCCDNVELHYR